MKARAVKSNARWALRDARNRFSEVVDAALRGQPQVVMRRGVETAVVIAQADYERIVGVRTAARPSLSEYLLAGHRGGAGEPFERITLRPRDAV
jgi:prevent-host-death family protein